MASRFSQQEQLAHHLVGSMKPWTMPCSSRPKRRQIHNLMMKQRLVYQAQKMLRSSTFALSCFSCSLASGLMCVVFLCFFSILSVIPCSFLFSLCLPLCSTVGRGLPASLFEHPPTGKANKQHTETQDHTLSSPCSHTLVWPSHVCHPLTAIAERLGNSEVSHTQQDVGISFALPVQSHRFLFWSPWRSWR